jgi:hypothetical protein
MKKQEEKARDDGRSMGGQAPMASPHPRPGVYRMRGRCITFAALALLVPAGSACGDEASARMQVSAVVMPHARLVGLDDTTVAVTAGDLERGYLDVTRRYEVRSNAPDRLLLQFHPRVGLTQAVDIRAFGGEVRLQDTTVEFAQPARGVFSVTYRLWLAPEVMPGQHMLPVEVVAAVR